MLQLIEKIELKQIQCTNEYQCGYQKALHDILIEIDELVYTEKGQIIKAINYGLGNEKEIELGEYYYNKYYKQNK